MPDKTPVSLIIDDHAPRAFVYCHLAGKLYTEDGRLRPKDAPERFLDAFCCVAESFGLKGKFSVVPMPGGIGRIDEELPGYSREEIRRWLTRVRLRLGGSFDFCPELLTHAGAIDLKTGKMTEEQENRWSFRQNAETLTEYITFALRILKNAGIDATGVTSPWDFGVQNEDAYARAVGRAVEAVSGRRESWYFCRSAGSTPPIPWPGPWVSVREEGRRVVAIPGTVSDGFWQTQDTTEASEAFIRRVADHYLTEDGRGGRIPEVLAAGGWPILTTHWQSLFSTGLETGLRALELVARRVRDLLGDRVEWTSFSELTRLTLLADDEGRPHA